MSIDLYPSTEIDLTSLGKDSVAMSTTTDTERYNSSTSCIVCATPSRTIRGLFCEASNHFHCDECITSWTKSLNEQKQEAPDKLAARRGLFLCVSASCPSGPFKASAVCLHINDIDVLEGFLDCLTHTHTLRIQEEYQAELAKQLSAIGAATGDAAGREKMKVELEALAQNLRLSMNNPRMCAQCKFGPVENSWCSDLACHHGDAMRENQPIVNNACPRCGWFTTQWEEWLPWDGNLPVEMKGGIEIIPASIPSNSISRTRLCRFFATGSCRRGASCTFRHTRSDAGTAAPPAVTIAPVETAGIQVIPRFQVQCRHFQRGECFRGSSCNFLHEADITPDRAPEP